MKNKLNHAIVALALLALSTLNSQLSTAHAQGTAFTYQGRLNTNGIAASGFYDFEFALYPNAAGTGTQLGSTFTQTATPVSNGLFIATINFGDEFTGNDVWLKISARSNGVGSYVGLTPLQELTPSPYAIFATSASNLSGTLSVSQITGIIPVTQLPSTVVTNDEGGVTLSNVTVGGDLNLPSPAVINAGGAPLLYSDSNGNFFAGLDAGDPSVSGSDNTGLGVQALNSITLGDYNTGIGQEALQNNSTGGLNTATGGQALWNNTNGIWNTAIGVDALAFNTSGSYNSAIGVGALENLKTGTNNIAIGLFAGSSYTGGASSNILIGNAGVSGDNFTIRIGDVQTTTYIAGLINGNGAGLTNLPNLSSLPNLNFFAGQDAGNGTLTGYDNAGVGAYALNALTSGSYNTAAGVGSLEDNTTGSQNTAVGDDAMVFNTTGSDNTAVGVDALAFNSSGYDNTATGYGALILNTTGYNNTADGYYAMGGSEVTGDGNTGVGAFSLENLTTAYNNTAVGSTALENNTTGVDNVGVGVNAIIANQTGSENTAIGTYTMVNLTNGSGNTAVGLYAGYYLDSGSDNIYIGSYGDATDNNVIRIGQSQPEIYLSGTLCVDGSTTNNGLTYATGPVNTNPLFGGEGVFLFGYNGGALGGLFPTTVAMSWDYSGDVWVNQNCSVGTLTIRGGSDLAEPFKITSDKNEVPEGSVVVIDEEIPGHLKVSSQPYDTRVAGILSGANGINPGIQMQQQGLLEGDRNVALTGRVYVQADASNGPIKPGDLLTTSSTPGRAMKVTDHVRAQGAILGKAMSGLSEGNGMVLVLVTLQ